VVCLRPARSQQRHHTTFVGHRPKNEAKEAEAEVDVLGKNLGSQGRGTETFGRECHQRNYVPRMVGKCSLGPQEDRQNENVHRFHRPQQSLHQGLLPLAKDRCLSRQGHRLLEILTARLFLGISPNLAKEGRRRQDKLHDSVWNILLYQNAQRSQER